MAKMTGMKCKVYIEDAATGKVLAGQKNASLKRSADSIDATSKDTAGNWKESLAGFKEWSVDCDGAFVESDVAYGLLETAFLNSENVDIYIEMRSGTKYSGNASITDFSLEFPYDDLVTYKIALQGSGELAVGA
jgi:TP901-1 family phage major tail protein